MKHFKYLLTLFTLLALVACGGGGSDDDSGDNGGGGGGLSTNACSSLGLSARIVNGTQCDESNSPVVELNLITDTGGILLCSGTMISATDVLTAAHCFPAQVRSAFVEVNGRRFNGLRAVIHPQYTPTATALFNDVAILQLDASPGLRAVPIVTSRAVVGGDKIQIFGYGQTEDESPFNSTSGILRSGEMLVTSVTEDHLITQFNGDGSNTCQGDSGGPALLTFSGGVGIVGITSSGVVLDCSAGDTSLFANVQGSKLLSFIIAVVPGVQRL